MARYYSIYTVLKQIQLFTSLYEIEVSNDYYITYLAYT